jgi:hypothetical protein
MEEMDKALLFTHQNTLACFMYYLFHFSLLESLFGAQTTPFMALHGMDSQ